MITATADDILGLRIALWRARLDADKISALRTLINETGMRTTAGETIDWLNSLPREGR